MAEGWRMWAISLLTMMLLLPFLSAAPLDIAGDIKKVDVEDDNDGMHSHDENVTRRGKFFGHNQFDVGNINVAGSVSGDVVSIGHEVKIDVHGHTHDHHHREDDTVIECKEGIRELFESIDSNRNGLMDVKELLRVCHQNNIKITKPLAVRILTLSDKTVGFNMAKFCELLKDCQSTNSVDVIYFLLQPYDKVAGCSRDEIEKLCSCPRDYNPVCAGGRLYNNLCLHECARKEAECADVQAISAVGDIAECVDPSTKGIVNRDAIKEFQMTLLNIEHELANLVNSRRKRDGLGFTEEQLLLLNSIEKGYTYLDIECSNNDGQCHVEKIKDSIEETKSSFTAVKEAGRVSSGFLEHFILERGKFDKIADVAGKVQEKAAVKLPLQGIIVDGGWSAWSSWSDCTGTCGEETRTRTRACSSPAGGKSCPGPATEAESCGLPSCEELVREVSSCSFDDEYLAEPDCEGQCAFYTTSPFKWENQIIPYYFTSATDKDKELFRSVMDKIEEKTCFTFQEKTEVEYESKHSLEIEISSKSCATGCEGFVYPVKKRYSDNPTRLILESKTQVNDRQDCKCAGFVLHQLMHVLGVEHTHARKDRDKFITVNDANVKSLGLTNRFKICEDCELNPDVPYDCKSIMHDGSHSAGGLELMKPIDPTTCILSKSAPWLDSSTGSELDWKLLNSIGKCPGTSILIESLEKAGKHQGLALGLYDLMPDKVNDRPAYSQKKGTGFIYYNAKKGDWRVGPTLGKASDWLAVTSEKKVPPTDDWKYLDGVKWESDDSTLELTASLSEPTNDCNIIRMESTGASGTSHSSSMGEYEWTKEWLNGRKIYKGGNGHYLRISSLTGHWGIAKDDGSSVIASGFGTTCPCEPENIKERDDWWTYLDAAKGTVDRNLKVTCEGNWGKWSHWSEVDSCDRQCGGGKQRFMKMRSCNNDPTECNGESRKIKEKNCAAASCDCKDEVFIETKTANITFALSPHTNSGSDWGEAERCPFPYFSNKMELRIKEICKRKNSRMSCREWHSSFKAIRLTCSDGITTTSSSEQLPSWDSLKECTEGSFIKKMRQKSTEFECTDGSQHRHVNYQGKYIKGAGTWSGWSSCEDGSAVYGIQTRVEADDSDTIKDVIFLCGELPVDKYHIETPRITFPDDRYGYWGDWGAVERCPFPHFANKMELKIEEQQRWDDTALNGIRLTCTDGATIITSSVGQWGSWGEVKECTEGTIKRTKLRREIPGGDDTSANGIRFECTDGTSHKPGDGYWGSWSEWRSCGDGSAVYGIQTRVEDSASDDTALNDVRFFCAKIIIPTG